MMNSEEVIKYSSSFHTMIPTLRDRLTIEIQAIASHRISLFLGVRYVFVVYLLFIAHICDLSRLYCSGKVLFAPTP